MVNFTPRIAVAVLAFAVMADALAVSASRAGSEVDLGTGKMVNLRLPVVEDIVGDPRVEVYTRSNPTASSASTPDADVERPLLRKRSYPGPRRLDSDSSTPYERRSRHSKHGKHGKHSKHRHHRDSKSQAAQANGTDVVAPAGGNVTAPLPPAVARRDVYVSAGENGPSIHIRPLSYYAQDTPLHIRELSTRGLLDPIIPILDDLLPPGLKGIVALVPELLNGLLGLALGDLIISPNKAAAHATGDNTKDELDSEAQYVLAAAKSNPSTIWLVDAGQPLPPSSDSTATEKMVSLQMAFVDAKTGEYEPYCATYEKDPERPVSLGVVPCKDANPAESQMFAYDPSTSILRAIWDQEGGKQKRQYYVGGGARKGDVQAEGAGTESMIVMVFQASNGTDAGAVVHTVPDASNSTIPTDEALDSPLNSGAEKNSTSSAGAQDEMPTPANDDDEDDADTTKSVADIPTATFSPGEQLQAAEATEAVTATSVEASATPVFVEHELESTTSAAVTATPTA